DAGDVVEAQERRQPLLKRAEHPFHAAAALWTVRSDMLDLELRQSPSHLGQALAIDLAPGCRRQEIMASTVGVERREQPFRKNRLVQTLKSRSGTFFLDEED